MTCIVISQPFFFPWVGLFEQIRLSDVFVHYDDVQFSKGHFANRVQVKTPEGSKWLTVPLRDLHLGQEIREVVPDDRQDWRGRHLATLKRSYAAAPFCEEMLALVEKVYARPVRSLADLSIASIEEVCEYYDLLQNRQFLRSSELAIDGASSRRVIDIILRLGGDVYVTGHGARNYLDHELFERSGVRVKYIDYRKAPYPQLHGAFTPSVSILDLIANQGREGRRVLCSDAVDWRQFLHRGAGEPAPSS